MAKLNVYFDSLPRSLDGLDSESFEQWTVVYNLGDRLIEIDRNGELVKNLVDSYKVSKDKMTYTFQLSSNRYFHNGEKITVDDIIYSLEKSMNHPKSYSQISSYLTSKDENGVKKVNGLKKESNNSFSITLKQPNYSFLERLNFNENMIRCKKSDLNGEIVYSGLYIPIENDLDFIELKVNKSHPNYSNSMYANIAVYKLPADIKDVEKVAKEDHNILIGRHITSLLSNENSSLIDLSYSLASGRTILLSLDQKISNVKKIKEIFNQILKDNDVLGGYQYIKYSPSIYPDDFSVYAPFESSNISTRLTELTELKIKLLPSLLNSSILSRIAKKAKTFNLNIEFSEVDSKKLSENLSNDNDYNAILTSIYIDTQDYASVTKGYFSGKFNFFEAPSEKHLKMIDRASLEYDKKERNDMTRNVLADIVNKENILPIIFFKNTIIVSKNINKSELGYFSNTIQFGDFHL